MKKFTKCKKILIEVNQTCNINCTYCFYRDYGRVSNFLKLENINKLLEICPNADEFYLTGGECFISSNIDEMIELLSSKGKVVVFTNGIVLNSYDKNHFYKVLNYVDRFIISFDSFDFDKYFCRNKLIDTYETINKILNIDPNKLEVKVCISNFNKDQLDPIFEKLVKLGVKKLSVNFVFDIKNSKELHEVNNIDDLEEIFKIIYKYKKYFNKKYIDMLYDLYINETINYDYPCLADEEYLYLDCQNNLLICPGNCKRLGDKGDWKKCFSKECANEWEIIYDRSD